MLQICKQNMTYIEEFSRWEKSSTLSEKEKADLERIGRDEEEMQSCFEKNLAFLMKP